MGGKLEYELVQTTYLKYNLRKGYFGVKYVFFSENYVKLEMTNNSVIGG
jgi:hypothetical protein